MRAMTTAALLFFAVAPAAAQSLPGDVAAGRALATRVCAACHVVTERQAWPSSDAVPTFASIARNPGTTEIGLRAFLLTPHLRMPNIELSRRETDDVISYILSLKRR
ncbi:MAG: c-type cytochrome [Proteobacteria bacterium]|nr:c-type cytochrome [Pseudomonadota bacterium]